MKYLFVFFTLIISQNIFAQNIELQIIQNSELSKLKSNTCKLRKAPFRLNFDMPYTDTTEKWVKLDFIATTQKSVYKRFDNDETIGDILFLANHPFAFDLNNQTETIVVGLNGYNSWFYTPSKNNLSNSTVKNKTIKCSVNLKNLLLDNANDKESMLVSLRRMPVKKMYLCFELKNDKNEILNKKHITLKFK